MKNNKLIAEFMRLKKHNKTEFLHNNLICSYKTMEYHTSWDWLMPVVEKINWHGYPLEGLNLANNVYCACGMAKIELIYKAVIEFIKWYNKQKTSK